VVTGHLGSSKNIYFRRTWEEESTKQKGCEGSPVHVSNARRDGHPCSCSFGWKLCGLMSISSTIGFRIQAGKRCGQEAATFVTGGPCGTSVREFARNQRLSFDTIWATAPAQKNARPCTFKGGGRGSGLLITRSAKRGINGRKGKKSAVSASQKVTRNAREGTDTVSGTKKNMRHRVEPGF